MKKHLYRHLIIGIVCLTVGIFLPSLFVERSPESATTPNKLAEPTLSSRRQGEPHQSATSESVSNARFPSLLDLAFTEQSEIRGTRHMIRALDQHNAQTAGEFASYFSSISFSKRHFHYWRLFFSSWGSFDAKAAITFIRPRFTQAALRQEFFYSVLKSWHKESPDEALRAAGDLLIGHPTTEGRLAMEYLRVLFEKDPDKGLHYLVRLSDPEVVMEVAGLQLKEFARTNPAAALAELASTEGEAKNYLTGQILNSWSESDPTAVADWLKNSNHPEISAGDLQAIASNFVKLDPTAAFEWITGLPDSLYSEELIQHASRTWAEVDPAGIKEWLAAHEPSAEADPVVISLAKSLAKSTPTEALVAANRLIHDPSKNQETLYELAMEWQNNEPLAFQSWLEDTPLIPATQKQRLLAREFQGSSNSPASPSTAEPLSNGRNGE